MKDRVISAFTLVTFLAAIVIFNHSFPLALNIAIALVSVLAVYEIVLALGISKKYMLVIPSLVFSAVLFFLPGGMDGIWCKIAYYLYTVVLFAAVVGYHRTVSFRKVAVVYSMSLMIPSMLGTLISLREFDSYHGMFYTIVAIFSAWISDMGAFFAGSLWGTHKLCPQISPKKTVEGAVGGIVLDVVAMLLFGYVFHVIFYAYQVDISYLSLLLIGAGGSVMSILGDLSFSLIKRSCHIKDFGNLIPGHGGILDRFDSVIFVSPFVYFLVQFMPIVIR